MTYTFKCLLAEMPGVTRSQLQVALKRRQLPGNKVGTPIEYTEKQLQALKAYFAARTLWNAALEKFDNDFC